MAPSVLLIMPHHTAPTTNVGSDGSAAIGPRPSAPFAVGVHVERAADRNVPRSLCRTMMVGSCGSGSTIRRTWRSGRPALNNTNVIPSSADTTTPLPNVDATIVLPEAAIDVTWYP